MPTLTDLIGLNETQVRDMPVAAVPDDLGRLWAAGARLSLAGARCSQGGHTMLTDGRVVLMETLSRPIEVDPDGFKPSEPHDTKPKPTVTAAAGASWSEVHHQLNRHGLAPLVHQSSAHFTVGGALSVNCHGRDPRMGPISNTVNWLEVWQPDGIVRASREQNADLFRAALGGYGSCGPIVRANFRVTPNLQLEQVAHQLPADKYGDYLRDLAARDEGDPVHLQYGWLRCTSLDRLFDRVLVAEYKKAVNNTTVSPDLPLPEEQWGESELMRAGWEACRQGYGPLRAKLWDLIVEYHENRVKSRLEWMRASVSFTSRAGRDSTDMLQEFFVPLERFDDMLGRLRAILQNAGVNVLSGTVRLVRRDDVPCNLSYCAQSAMACIALDVDVPVEGSPRAPSEATRRWVEQAIAAAASLGGTFYLPYYRFATKDRVRQLYGAGWQAQEAAIARYNADRRWWNAFLGAYF